MPIVWLSDEELEALRAVFSCAERVDWKAYDRARARITDSPISIHADDVFRLMLDMETES